MDLKKILPHILRAAGKIMFARDKEKAVAEMVKELLTADNIGSFCDFVLKAIQAKQQQDGCIYTIQGKTIGEDDFRIDVYRTADGAAPVYMESFSKNNVHALIKKALDNANSNHTATQ